MTNRERILKRRWSKTDRALEKADREIHREYRYIGDDIFDELNILKPKHSNLSNKVPEIIRRRIQRRMERYRRDENFYILYLLLTMNYTYKKALEFFIYDAFYTHFKEIDRISHDVFKTTANDLYQQGINELGVKRKPLTEAQIDAMAKLPALDQTYAEHIGSEAISQAQEMNEYILSVLLTDDDGVTEELIQAKLKKMGNRIILVQDGKSSGTLDDTSRIVGNTAFITVATADEKEKFQVRFIAELDDRTTKMCKSLDLQLFWANDWNEFYRWSDLNKDYVKVRIFGLQTGVNLPPITDHFHWCRSTITYDISGIGMAEAIDAQEKIEKRRRELNP